ncbi:MAG: peptidoglycan-binding domain-containing protein [bacterium]|nr:peptidoglycan-binding domain-containing protein [bacterium]
MSKLLTKISTTVVSVATVVSLSGAGALLPVAYGATVEELQAQINALLTQITALQAQLSGTPSTVVAGACSWTRSLTVGFTGEDVRCLQKYLNAAGHAVAASGAGSVGNESTYFGSLTRAAVAKWQAANGVVPAVGYFGPLSQAKYNSMAGGVVTVPGTTTPAPVPAGSGLTVSLASDQPVSSLAPGDAARIPFTKVLLTASADGDVTVNSLTVERIGLAADAALDGVLLLDSVGNQLGIKKTLNSEHKANVGETFVVKAGQTVSVVVAANRAAVGGSYGGQTLALRVTAVNTSASVFGTPLVGTTHTINETLTIGSVTMARGPLDPGSSQTKEIGTTGYVFSSVKVTAGSAEKIYVKSIRWNQTGSAGKADLENVKTIVDGVSYDTVVSSDGKYYSTVFPGSGILMDKGFNKEIVVKGDVVSGSSRTVDFDLAKRTDLFVVGETYGYGIVPPQTGATDPTDDTAAFSNVEDPWYDAAQVTISTGTMSVSSWNTVAAQNIAVNLADQPLGGWSVEVKGEAISVSNMKFQLLLTEDAGGTTGLGMNDLDNVKIVDESGKVLAGPLDASGTTLTGPSLTFTDTITFPIGVTNFKLVGKLAAGTAAFENNDTLQASSTPSTWTTTGQSTGNAITPSPTSAVAGQQMTAKGPALTISVSAVPIAQTVIAGVNQFEFARYILDTSASGEDLRLTSLPLEYNPTTGNATDLTNCKLYDGVTILNSGSNAVSPSARSSTTAFTFDGTGLTLTKGTSKQLSLKCDLKSAATGSYSWGYDSTAAPSPTGLVSGQTATLTENDNIGQLMTAATVGSMSVSLDSAAPYMIVAPGQTVELAKLKFSATNEDVSLKQVSLMMSGAASNTPINLVGQQVTLWDGATQVGAATFPGSEAAGVTNRATSTNITNFVVPKDGSKVLTVKGVISGISASGPMTRSGDFPKLNYDGGGGLTATYGTGVSSGQTVSPTSASTDSTGVRIAKGYPSFSKIDLTSSERAFTTGVSVPFYKFKVTANSGDISLAKLTFSFSSSTVSATTSRYSLFVFTDAGFSSADGNFSGANNPGGLVNAGNCYSGGALNTAGAFISGGLQSIVEIYPDVTGCNLATTTIKIPSGESRWFRLEASVATLAPSGTAESMSVQLEGDAAFPTNIQGGSAVSGDMGTFGHLGEIGVNDATHNDFLWSPRSTSTNESDSAYLNNLDWTNGYGVMGLPSTNMTSETLTK